MLLSINVTFLDVPLLYCSVTIDESKEKFGIVFCSYLETQSVVAPSSSSNFPRKEIISEILVFVCLDKSLPMSLWYFWWYK